MRISAGGVEWEFNLEAIAASGLSWPVVIGHEVSSAVEDGCLPIEEAFTTAETIKREVRRAA